MTAVKLKAPASIEADLPERKGPVQAAKTPPIAPDRLQSLEKQVKLVLEESASNTSILRKRLRALNDMLEGVVQEVNYPFSNASNVDVKMAIGTARTMRATMVRALFADPDRVFVASIDDEEKREDANEIEDAFNWKASHDNGLVDALKDALIPVFRDGTAFLQGTWERRVERVMDYKTYLTAEDFLADYPDYNAAGISEEAFHEQLIALGEQDGYIDVVFEHDMVVKDEADFSVVPLGRFYWWPLSAASLAECELYGVRMVESEATMKRKSKNKEYFKEAVDACLASGKNASPVPDVLDRSRDFIEGISSSSLSTTHKEFSNYRLVLKVDLDDDDIAEKYTGVYNLDLGRFLSFDRYRIRKNIDFLVPLRFDRRDGRLLGRSLAYDGMDIFQEITDIHRHRNNRRAVTDAPGWKAEDDLKEHIEATLNDWHPGSVLWLPTGKIDKVQQMISQDLSRTGDIDEENLLVRYVEFVVVPALGLSGKETPEDPRAPATKHLSKIRQAGFRVDDYIDEFKRTFPDIARLALALYYQWGPRKVRYQNKSENGLPRRADMDASLFGAEGLTLGINARSVIMSPEFEMERIMALRAEASQNPFVISNKPQVLGLLWDRFIAASRVQNPEELKLGDAATQLPAPPPIPGAGIGVPAPAGGGVGTGVPPLKSLLSSLGINNGRQG